MAAEEAPVVLKHMAFELAVRTAVELAMKLLMEQMDSLVNRVDY